MQFTREELYRLLKAPVPVALAGVDLSRSDLLWGIDLRLADLSGAMLRGADLHGADLRWADLRWAILVNADLQQANLQHADVSAEQLARARSLQGATLPDGVRRG